jgi:cytochrome P450
MTVLPIDGTSLLDPDVIANPYEFYGRLRTEAPVWEVPGTGVFTVSTYALASEGTARVQDLSSNLRCILYRDENGLPRRLPFDTQSQVLAVADPPMHALHRKTIFPELVARRMAELEPEIRSIADCCVSDAIDRGTVDFMDVIGNVIPITIISRLIGFVDGDLDQLLAAAFDATAMVGATDTLEELTARVERGGDFREWIADQFRTFMKNPGDCLLGTMARGVRDGIFTEDGAHGTLHLLLSAGGESTSSLLGNAARMLAEQPQLQDRLRHHPELIPVFMEEALRLEPPFRQHMRFAPQDTELGGVSIPGGSVVLLTWGAANRDPDEFDRPDEIRLERPARRRHLAFGRGIHFCVGAPLARLEAQILLTMLLERTSHIVLAPEAAPHWVNSLFVRRHDRLPLQLTAA